MAEVLYNARRLNSAFWAVILVFDSCFLVLFLSDIEPYNFVENFFWCKVIRLNFLFFWSSWIRKKLDCKRNLAGLVWWEIKNVLHVRVHTCKYAISGLKMVRFDFFLVLLLSPLSSWFQGLVSISGFKLKILWGCHVRVLPGLGSNSCVPYGIRLHYPFPLKNTNIN